jgi:hypothetical protein
MDQKRLLQMLLTPGSRNAWYSVGLFLVLLMSCDSWTLGQQKVALVIGVDEYEKKGFSNLTYAEADMRTLGEKLRTNGFEVLSLLGSDTGSSRATGGNIRDILKGKFGQRLSTLKKQDIVLIALAGHGRHSLVEGMGGTRKEDHFFCPVDAHDNDEKTWISISDLISQIESLSGSENNLVLIDACRDNPNRGRGIDGKGFVLNKDAVAVFFSASYNERAWEPAKLKHGLFTYYVLDALNGKAADFEGNVTWDSMVGYVKTVVSRESQKLLAEGEIQSVQRPNAIGNLRGSSPVLARSVLKESIDPRLKLLEAVRTKTQEKLSDLENPVTGSEAWWNSLYLRISLCVSPYILASERVEEDALLEILRDVDRAVLASDSASRKAMQSQASLISDSIHGAVFGVKIPVSTNFKSVWEKHQAKYRPSPTLTEATSKVSHSSLLWLAYSRATILRGLAEGLTRNRELRRVEADLILEPLEHLGAVRDTYDVGLLNSALGLLFTLVTVESAEGNEASFIRLRSRLESIGRLNTDSEKLITQSIETAMFLAKNSSMKMFLNQFSVESGLTLSGWTPLLNQDLIFIYSFCDCDNEVNSLDKLLAMREQMGSRRPKVVYACPNSVAADKVKDREDVTIILVKDPPKWLVAAPIIAIGDAQGRLVAGSNHGVTDDDVEVFIKALSP